MYTVYKCGERPRGRQGTEPLDPDRPARKLAVKVERLKVLSTGGGWLLEGLTDAVFEKKARDLARAALRASPEVDLAALALRRACVIVEEKRGRPRKPRPPIYCLRVNSDSPEVRGPPPP
jgi:hypothetical protein